MQLKFHFLFADYYSQQLSTSVYTFAKVTTQKVVVVLNVQKGSNKNVTYEDRPKIAGAWWQKLHVLIA